jgi:excisionase family DNA binding protein
MDNLLLKIPEVAENLGISRAKVYELMAAGDLPSVKIGGCRRVRAVDLVAYVESSRRLPDLCALPMHGQASLRPRMTLAALSDQRKDGLRARVYMAR